MHVCQWTAKLSLVSYSAEGNFQKTTINMLAFRSPPMICYSHEDIEIFFE